MGKHPYRRKPGMSSYCSAYHHALCRHVCACYCHELRIIDRTGSVWSQGRLISTHA